MPHIGPRVRERRVEIGWTVQGLADALNRHQSYISRLENEKVGWTQKTLKQISDVLDKPESWFVEQSKGTAQVVTKVLPSVHRSVPRLSLRRVAQMHGREFSVTADELASGTVAKLEHSPESFQIAVEGRDMWPDYQPGQLLVFDRLLKPEPGDVVLVEVAGLTLLRNYRALPMGGGAEAFEVFPSNRAFATFCSSDPQQPIILGVMAEEVSGRKSRRNI